MKYNVYKDSMLIREFFHLSQTEFADILGVTQLTINRIENNEFFPRKEFIEKLYEYCYSRKLKLNIQKEMFYLDGLESNHILLTHGSKEGIEGDISVDKGREKNDFGKGFYCAESYNKSISFVSKFPNSCIYFFDFDITNLKNIVFNVDKEWMLAIAYFRGRLDKYKDSKIIKDIIEKINKVDYIIAPIADNRMFQIIDTFIEGEITDEQCLHSLAATNLGKQYVFKKEKAVKQLKILENCFVSKVEKEDYIKEQINYQKDGEDKSKLARIKYRGKGKYIEELLND